MTRITAVTALSLLVLPACSDLLIDPFRYGEVRVLATRRSGVPAAGVDLVLYTGTRHLAYGTTGDEGTAQFGFVPEGPLGVSVVPGVYRALDAGEAYTEFSMSEGEIQDIRFIVLGPGALRVAVVDAQGIALAGLPVQVYEGTGTLAQQTTTAGAPLLFDRLGVGVYGVRVLEREWCALPPDGFVYSDGHRVTEDAVTDVTLVVADC